MNIVFGALIVASLAQSPSLPCFWSADGPRRGATSAMVTVPQASSVCWPPGSHCCLAS